MCKLFKVGKSSYYKWIHRKPSKRQIRNTMLKAKVEKVYKDSKGRYGSPRITKELNMQGISVSKVLVAKLMQQLYLRSIVKKRYKVTTNSSHKYPVVENVLNRVFETKIQNAAWVSDITYIATKQNWLYLTTVIDLFDRKVIGWSLSDTMKAVDTVIPAFKMAKINRPINKEQSLIFHSDRGIQYACKEFTDVLNLNKNIIRSMSRKGNCWDNAPQESFFGRMKDHIGDRIQECTTYEEVAVVIDDWMDYYNNDRYQWGLAKLSPNEYYQYIITGIYPIKGRNPLTDVENEEGKER